LPTGAFAGQTNEFEIRDSRRRLSTFEPNGEIATISAMPPAKTGIAYFTRNVAQSLACNVDIFTAHRFLPDYLAEHDRPGGIRCFAADALPAFRERQSWRAEIFVLGNSSHNQFVLQALRMPPTNAPRFVHLHDPCLFKLLENAELQAGRRPIAALLRHYPELIDERTARKLRSSRFISCNPAQLVSRGIYGLRPLLNGISLDGVIVHSQAAADIVGRELPWLPPSSIHTLFHPVFPAAQAPPERPPSHFRIGSFGIQDFAKGSDLLVAAFRRLRARFPTASLLLAGYGASLFANGTGLHEREGFEIVDSPSDSELQRLMASCSLAVQLRRLNTGESSGVVPQLIALGTPVVVSDIGSFREFGQAVRTVPVGIKPAALAEILATELQTGHERRPAMQAYAAGHTVERFVSLLDSILPAASDPVARRCG
jgi:glycosyltransferase involved in cell wall biosynthesis